MVVVLLVPWVYRGMSAPIYERKVGVGMAGKNGQATTGVTVIRFKASKECKNSRRYTAEEGQAAAGDTPALTDVYVMRSWAHGLTAMPDTITVTIAPAS